MVQKERKKSKLTLIHSSTYYKWAYTTFMSLYPFHNIFALHGIFSNEAKTRLKFANKKRENLYFCQQICNAPCDEY